MEYFYYIFGITKTDPPKNTKRKYDDSIDITNIIVEKRIRKKPVRYSV